MTALLEIVAAVAGVSAAFFAQMRREAKRTERPENLFVAKQFAPGRWQPWQSSDERIATAESFVHGELIEQKEDDGGLADLYANDVREWDAQLRAGRRDVAQPTHVEPARDEAFDGLSLIARKEWFAIQHMAEAGERVRLLAKWEEHYAPLFREARKRGLLQ